MINQAPRLIEADKLLTALIRLEDMRPWSDGQRAIIRTVIEMIEKQEGVEQSG